MVDKWRGYSHAGFNKGCRERGGGWSNLPPPFPVLGPPMRVNWLVGGQLAGALVRWVCGPVVLHFLYWVSFILLRGKVASVVVSSAAGWAMGVINKGT